MGRLVKAHLVAVLCMGTLMTACSNERRVVSQPEPDVSSPSPSDRETTQASEPVRGPIAIDLRLVAEGFDSPLGIANAGDGSGDLFIVEQGGRIWRIRGDRVDKEPFLDVTPLVVSGGEQGLLGLAFHPQHESNGLFYVNYTDTSGDTVVAEYERRGDRADPSSARILLQIDQPYSNHNGGNLVFGPDGYLYIGMGDGGAAGDPERRAQNPAELLGKMLRIDVDARSNGAPYGIPKDNPFVGEAGKRPEIWDYGLRNPWRYSFDRATGDLWIGDVGQSALEEVDHSESRDGGTDWGWDDLEGTECYEPPSGCETSGKVLPVTQYDHSQGCAITGGFVYRGERQPRLVGRYVFGDYCSGLLWTVYSDAAGFQKPMPAADTGTSISSFGEAEDGELYLTDLEGGGVYQVVVR
jgi:glucose/arabinose dehydrogenase